jgi:hypothetical protein
MQINTVLVVAALAATVVALVAGVASMVKNGEIAHHTSEQWMAARVGLQAGAVSLIAFALFGW